MPGGAGVVEVSLWWSVCRVGGFLGDGGAGGFLVGDGLVLGAGGEQRGDGEAVDGAGHAAGVAVDDADGVVGEEGVGAAGVGEVGPDIAVGLGGGERGGGKAYLSWTLWSKAAMSPTRRRLRRVGWPMSRTVSGEPESRLWLVIMRTLSSWSPVSRCDSSMARMTLAALVGFGGERRLDLGDEVGGVEAGGLAEGLGDGAVDAADPDLGVGQVDEGVAGGVEAVGGGAERNRLPGADFAGQDAEAAGGDQPAQAGDGFLVGGGGEQRGAGM